MRTILKRASALRHASPGRVRLFMRAPADPVHTLYVEHHGWLQGWLRRKLGNVFEASDIAHDTFVNVITSGMADRKSTRLNSSHLVISYAVFCLKKKKKTKT